MEPITSRRNPLIAHIRALGSDGDYRRERREFVCAGVKALREAAASGAEVTAIVSCSGTDAPRVGGTVAVSAAREVLQTASPFNNPRDVLFVCRMPDAPFAPGRRDLRVILENIQDPGNLGAIIRAADAFEIGEVVMTGACADLYNPKTVRASTGAIFRQRVVSMTAPEISGLKANGVKIYGAAADGGIGVREAELSGAAVAIGNEGCGLSRELRGLCDGAVSIPMSPAAESLNAAVAAAIIMWECFASQTRRRE
ncbi:MAG: RNA methyltransferase [Oscillospiraceae bacterium]|jgi:TrmH family RNA methyltransferase|nr:RNA methyltransferase [Oscillospiraceae bacterium]